MARAAGVAEKTVYNHFGTKAGLFFDEADDLLTPNRLAANHGQSRPSPVRKGGMSRMHWY